MIETSCDWLVFVNQALRLHVYISLTDCTLVSTTPCFTYLNFSDLAEGSERVARKTEIRILTFILSLSLSIFRL